MPHSSRSWWRIKNIRAVATESIVKIDSLVTTQYLLLLFILYLSLSVCFFSILFDAEDIQINSVELLNLWGFFLRLEWWKQHMPHNTLSGNVMMYYTLYLYFVMLLILWGVKENLWTNLDRRQILQTEISVLRHSKRGKTCLILQLLKQEWIA